MSRRIPALACAAAIACAGTFASLPAHADRVAWNVTIGGPGFAVSAGQPWGGWGPGSVVRPVVTPWAPVVAPAPVFMPAPPVFVPRIVPVVRPWIRPVPVFRPRPVIVYRGW